MTLRQLAHWASNLGTLPSDRSGTCRDEAAGEWPSSIHAVAAGRRVDGRDYGDDLSHVDCPLFDESRASHATLPRISRTPSATRKSTPLFFNLALLHPNRRQPPRRAKARRTVDSHPGSRRASRAG